MLMQRYRYRVWELLQLVPGNRQTGRKPKHYEQYARQFFNRSLHRTGELHNNSNYALPKKTLFLSLNVFLP